MAGSQGNRGFAESRRIATIARQAYDRLAEFGRTCVPAFLKSLQVLDGKTTSRIVDEDGRPQSWPPRSPPTPKH
ncbi:MAG: hypothetical protein K9N23_21385 [Akkermansiaceae bacterium]|nr:hypothetical protein [Akkermansiaceae bacterium]